MNKPKIPPTLYSGLSAILPLAIGTAAWVQVAKQEVLTLPTQQVILWVTLFLSIIVALAVHCVQLTKAFDLKIVRREMIQKWRREVDVAWENNFINSSLYSEIRFHLDKRTLDTVECRQRTIIRDRKGDISKTALLDNISRIEKKWGLI